MGPSAFVFLRLEQYQLWSKHENSPSHSFSCQKAAPCRKSQKQRLPEDSVAIPAQHGPALVFSGQGERSEVSGLKTAMHTQESSESESILLVCLPLGLKP